MKDKKPHHNKLENSAYGDPLPPGVVNIFKNMTLEDMAEHMYRESVAQMSRPPSSDVEPEEPDTFICIMPRADSWPAPKLRIVDKEDES
ncbi:MAG: hypothetical protein RPU32_00765 [Candidatus Sedimenticola sp. (ex Thyasira tokunagai)]